VPDIKEKTRHYFESASEVIAAYIFGSFAKGKINPFSDLDIAVLVDDEVKECSYPDLRLKFMMDLSSSLKKETDVVILDQAPPFLRHQKFKYGKVILERDVKRSRFFKAKSILEYFDFKPIKDFIGRHKTRSFKYSA